MRVYNLKAKHDGALFTLKVCGDEMTLNYRGSCIRVHETSALYQAAIKGAHAIEQNFNNQVEVTVIEDWPEPRGINTDALCQAIKTGQVDKVFKTKAAGTL